MNPKIMIAFRADIIIIFHILGIDHFTAAFAFFPQTLRNIGCFPLSVLLLVSGIFHLRLVHILLHSYGDISGLFKHIT